jgi:hypothetical protein
MTAVGHSVRDGLDRIRYSPNSGVLADIQSLQLRATSRRGFVATLSFSVLASDDYGDERRPPDGAAELTKKVPSLRGKRPCLRSEA